MKHAAKDLLAEWMTKRSIAIQAKINYNTEAESIYLEARQKNKGESSWKRVVSMLDFKERTETKDRTRIRSVLMAKKAEG
jgi:hypothetical protein